MRANERVLETTANDAQLRAALADANLPTLLLVLAQLTGSQRWLEKPYQPTRTVALNDNDSGGLSPELQSEVRAAALNVLSALRDGDRELPPPPPDERIIDMLSVSLGEQVPPEYATTMAEEAGFRPRSPRWTGQRPPRADQLHVLVIGAGPSGVAAAVMLGRLGIRYTVIERNHAVGGVWWANDYPGAGVDTPTHMYSFSFGPRQNWTHYYAKQPEILEYIQRTARDFGVLRHIRFGTEVVGMTWDERTQCWHVDVRSSHDAHERLDASVVISCVGQLNRPAVPELPGMDAFTGPMFHSSQWDHHVDITGKRVAVIGTGATSMQIVPAICGKAEKVIVFQRSPQWVVPNTNYLRRVPQGTMLLMEQVPYYAAFYRLRLIWQFQDKLLSTLYRDPEWPHPERSVNAANDKHRVFLTKHIDAELGGRKDLRDKVLPDYPPYGKRILMDNNWFRTLLRGDVELVDQSVSGFDQTQVLTADGSAHRADVIVLATGFQTRRMLSPMDIRGRSGVPLREQWGDDDAFAYLGISVPDFPNLFIVGGPHTALGHGGSAIYVAECSISYIAQVIVHMAEHELDSVEVRSEVTENYNKDIDARHQQLVWTHPGMTNWYRNATGRVVVTMPWRNVDYWAMTRNLDIADYIGTGGPHE
jgi:4-hydroxyacetophenone monooxygenase